MVTVLQNKGGVHICKLAYGDLTWEKSMLPKPFSTLEGPGSITCGQYLDRTLGKFPPIYGPHLPCPMEKSSVAQCSPNLGD